MKHCSRRRFLVTVPLAVASAGCLDQIRDRADPPSYPKEPPDAAIETVKSYFRAIGEGRYVEACRDRCRLAMKEGKQQFEAKEMDEQSLRSWAREAESWYGRAGEFEVTSMTVADTQKIDPKTIAPLGYEAGYTITIRWEGTGNIVNPIQKRVFKPLDSAEEES